MEVIELQGYNLYVGTDFQPFLNAFLLEKKAAKVFVLTDENTHQHCFPILEDAFPDQTFHNITIPAGEVHKNIETCQLIWAEMMKGKGNRNSLCLNLGGGVIGDMGGFCAATFKRGMDFIQIPTTLLSQVDASIGGKLGIDFQGVKNSIGLFTNPKAVFINPDFFKTLPTRELRSGFAEVIKHSLIADKAQWDNLKQISVIEAENWAERLIPSLMVKKKIVEIDPFEKGLRKALNFGHTIGHAVESVFLETSTPLLHGEAIAVGMVCEAYLAHKQMGLSQEALMEITQFILKIYGKIELKASDYPHFIAIMQQDKKNDTQAINFSFLPDIGQVKVNETASETTIFEALNYYQNLV